MGLTKLTLLLTLPGLLTAAEAEAADKKSKTDGSATVTVTAEATPVEVAKTPNPVKIFTPDMLEKLGARSLTELLRTSLPGQVSQNGGPGTLSQLNLGGTRPTDTVVTLDGLRMQDSLSIGTNMSLLSMIGVDRLEIQQGPCSTLYGSDAMGGVLALYTAAPATKGYAGQATLGLGTEGSRLARLRQSFATDRAWVRLDAEGSEENPSLQADHKYRHAGSSLAAGLDLWDGATLRLGHRAFYVAAPLPISYVSTSFRSYDPTREGSAWNEQFRANLTTDLGKGIALETALGHSTQTRMEPKYGGGQMAVNTTLDQGKATLSAALRPLSYSVVVDATRERGDGSISNYQTYANFDTWGDKRGLALASEIAFEPEASPLRLVLSARDEETTQTTRIAGATLSGSVDSRSFTWKSGATLRLSEAARVYASTGTGFSTPLLYQVLFNAVNAGEALQNEQSRFIQAGFGYGRGPWAFRLDAQSLHFDRLVYFDLDPAKYKYYNGQDLRFRSLEAELGYTATTWSLAGYLRTQEARRLGVAPEKQLNDGAVIRRPFFVGGLRGGFKSGALSGDAAWSWSGSRYENFGNGIRPSRTHYNDLSLNLGYAVCRSVDVWLRGRNLMQGKVNVEDWKAGRTDFQNDAYQIYNFPAQPRTVSLELKVRW